MPATTTAQSITDIGIEFEYPVADASYEVPWACDSVDLRNDLHLFSGVPTGDGS